MFPPESLVTRTVISTIADTGSSSIPRLSATTTKVSSARTLLNYRLLVRVDAWLFVWKRDVW